MTLDENKALARRALDEVWSTGDVDAVDEIFAPDFVSHQHSHPDGPGDVADVGALKAFVREFHAAFPDFSDTVDDQLAEGDKVVTRFTSSGTHEGPLMGVEPTGTRVSWMGITIDRIENGRIVENWVSWDMHGMLQQLRSSRKPG